jgi:RNA polymerase sigma factor (sigma-70 family)
MANTHLDTAVQRLRRVTGRGADDRADGELLAAFADRADEAAFEAIVRRHGALVLGVCSRVLGDDHDAEDAFQAAFLVLARSAGAIRARQSLASWLHGVALRVARKAKARAARRRECERRAEPVRPDDPFGAVEWRDLRPILDEELDRLGDKYRGPLVLCYLEGHSHEEAARRLGWPNGTVCGRLARGRDLLRRRLEQRGIACAVLPALPVGASQAAVPPALVSSAVQAARLVATGQPLAAVLPPETAVLADGVGGQSFRWGLKLAAAASLALGVAGLAIFHRPVPEPGGTPPPARPEPGVVRLDCGHGVLAVAASPDGRLVATGGSGPVVWLWRAEDGAAAATLGGHEGGVAALVFAPDGATVAAAGHDHTIRLWDVAAGKPRFTLEGHDDVVAAVAFSPDGTLLVSAGWDSKVCLWDALTGEKRRELDGHRGRVWAVAFSPDGKSVATAGGDKTVRLWDVTTGRHLHQVGRHGGGVYALAFAPDGRALVTSEDNTVRLWEVASGREAGRVAEPGGDVRWFALSADGRTIAWGGADQHVRLWEPASGSERLRLEGAGAVGCLAFAADGRTLVAGGADGTAVVWDLKRFLNASQPAPQEVEPLWRDLGRDDSRRAFRAVWALAADPGQSAPFLAERLGAHPDFDKTLARLIGGLDDDRFAVRERAEWELADAGAAAGPALRRALEGQPSPEARNRMERLLKQLDAPADTPPLQQLRALEALERAGTAEAKQALEALAKRTPETPLSREATLALGRVQLGCSRP